MAMNITFTWNYSRPMYVVDPAMVTWGKVRVPLLATGGALALIFGVVGSILGILVIYRNRDKKRFGFLGITGSLLVSCLLYKVLGLAFIFPTWLHGYQWFYGLALCKVFMFMQHINMFSICYHTILLFLYVILCIRHPLVASKLDRPRNIAILLAITWVAMFLLNVEYLSAYKLRTHTGEEQYCHPIREGYNSYLAIMIITVIFGFLIPVPMVIIMSIVICVSARKRKNNRYVNLDNEEERHLQDFVRTSTAIVLLMLCIVLPAIIYRTAFIGGFNIGLMIISEIHAFFTYFYPAIFPYILLFCVQDYKYTLLQLFGRHSPPRPSTLEI